SWTDRTVVLPYTAETGNWDCGICELDDGTLLIDLTIAAYFKRGIRPEQPSWTRGPLTDEHGDWTWSYKTMGWLGTYVLRAAAGACNGRSCSTMALAAASIVDYEEPAIVRLADGRIVGMLRTHVNPSGDAKNMAIVVSEDDGFSWTPPRFTNIWGYPAEFATLPDGRILMIYGYRRPPYGVRGCVSDDGVTWDVANEFTIREGGVPAAFYDNPGVYQHIGYPSVALLGDGSVLAMYPQHHENRERPPQFV